MEDLSANISIFRSEAVCLTFSSSNPFRYVAFDLQWRVSGWHLYHIYLSLTMYTFCFQTIINIYLRLQIRYWMITVKSVTVLRSDSHPSVNLIKPLLRHFLVRWLVVGMYDIIHCKAFAFLFVLIFYIIKFYLICSGISFFIFIFEKKCHTSSIPFRFFTCILFYFFLTALKKTTSHFKTKQAQAGYLLCLWIGHISTRWQSSNTFLFVKIFMS